MCSLRLTCPDLEAGKSFASELLIYYKHLLFMQKEIKIYTDGAARGNPGPAGWGAVFLFGDKIFEMGGRFDHATNNQMELTGPIEALKYIQKNKIIQDNPVHIVSDSKYVILGITEWILNWQKNNWRNAA